MEEAAPQEAAPQEEAPQEEAAQTCGEDQDGGFGRCSALGQKLDISHFHRHACSQTDPLHVSTWT